MAIRIRCGRDLHEVRTGQHEATQPANYEREVTISTRQKELVDQYICFLNLLSSQTVAMYQACMAGDVARARAIWQWLLPLRHLHSHQTLGASNDIAIYRAVLEMLGKVGGYSRAHFDLLTASPRARLKS